MVIATLLMLILLWRYDFKVNAKVAALDDAAPRILSVADGLRDHSTPSLIS